MMRFATISLLTLCLFCLVHAQVAESVPIPSVAGTAWAGIINAPDSAGRFQDFAYEFEFLAGNKLRWRWRGTVYENATWRQSGRDIHIEMSDGHSTWLGTIEGDRMSGNSANQDGYKWNWVLLRQAQALPRSPQIVPVPSEWIRYSSTPGRFVLLMPAEPRVTEQGVETAVGKLSNNVFLSLTQSAAFVISYADLPPDFNPKGLLDNVRQGAIDGIKGTLISSSNIKHKGHPGREFQASSEGGIYTSKIFLVKTRIYQLVVVAQPGKVSDADVHRFLNSFDLKTEQ